MENRLDIIIFGASGFTGKYVLRQVHKLFKNVTWGVAGRNEKKLQNVLSEAAQHASVSDFKSIPIILANIEDIVTIKKMTAQAKVLINCCGPYDLHGGEIVVKSCIETGTHYIDVSAEGLFIETLLLKYAKAAEEKGVYIVNTCGFNCVAVDLAVTFLEQKFEGTLNSVEIYLHSRREEGSKEGTTINYSTWESVVNATAKLGKLKAVRKQLNEKQITGFKPKLSTKLPHKVENGWAVPFPGTDEHTIRRSQLYFYENNNKRPVQVRNYVVINTFQSIITSVILGVLLMILGQFSFGRKLLLKYPEFFSNGTFSHKAPLDNTLNRNRFSILLKGKGWCDKQLADNHYHTQPNKEIVGCISGFNPSYGFTGLSVALCALMIILEPKNLPPRGGVYTPAAAFSKTSLIEQLEKNDVNFEILSIKNIKQ